MSAGDATGMGAALAALADGRELPEELAARAVDDIMAGTATGAQTGAFLMGLRLKGETEAEIAGVARALRARATPVATPPGPVIDTCGTGGDGLRTFNISTAAAFVVAGAGLPVAKHGNRSVSSRCGSADVLEALGVPMLDDPEALARCLRRHRMAFLFAPHLHPAMRHAAGPRRELGVRTVFNLAGPLANPAAVRHQLMGVPQAALAPVMARVLGRLGSARAWVVCGEGGMDELTCTGPSTLAILSAGQVEEQTLDPRDLGLPRARLEDLQGGDAAGNAARIEAILGGEPGPGRDVVLLNAAAALVVGEVAGDLFEGLSRAAASIDSGAARRVLDGLRRRSGEVEG